MRFSNSAVPFHTSVSNTGCLRLRHSAIEPETNALTPQRLLRAPSESAGTRRMKEAVTGRRELLTLSAD
jgi:hypothetical protein